MHDSKKESLERLAKDPRYSACEAIDNGLAFQRRARLLQSIWRHRGAIPMGMHEGRLLGSRVDIYKHIPLINFLTPGIQEVVQQEVFSPEKSKGKLYKLPRIVEDLLTSQALCFNLFGEIKHAMNNGDPENGAELATKLFSDCRLVPAIADSLAHVVRLEFEYSPDRCNTKYTNDRTAFDVFVEYRDRQNRSCFIGIEVKYHETMKPSSHKGKESPGKAEKLAHYVQLADRMGCFYPDSYAALRQPRLEQIWRDHLLAGSMVLCGDFHHGQYVFLYPAENSCCGDSITEYLQYLSPHAGCTPVHLERFVSVLQDYTDAEWVKLFQARYLDFSDLDELVEASDHRTDPSAE